MAEQDNFLFMKLKNLPQPAFVKFPKFKRPFTSSFLVSHAAKIKITLNEEKAFNTEIALNSLKGTKSFNNSLKLQLIELLTSKMYKNNFLLECDNAIGDFIASNYIFKDSVIPFLIINLLLKRRSLIISNTAENSPNYSKKLGINSNHYQLNVIINIFNDFRNRGFIPNIDIYILLMSHIIHSTPADNISKHLKCSELFDSMINQGIYPTALSCTLLFKCCGPSQGFYF